MKFLIIILSLFLTTVAFSEEISCNNDKTQLDHQLYFSAVGNHDFSQKNFVKFKNIYWERIKKLASYYDVQKSLNNQKEFLKKNENFIFNVMRPYVEAELSMEKSFKSYQDMMVYLKNSTNTQYCSIELKFAQKSMDVATHEDEERMELMEFSPIQIYVPKSKIKSQGASK